MDKKAYNKAYYKLKVFPKIFKHSIHAGTKKHCIAFYNVLKDGLVKDNLVKPKLSSLTMKIRKNTGSNATKSPLVGKRSTRTLVNNMEYAKTDKGWVLRPNKNVIKNNNHSISVKRLWMIHENGLHGGVTNIPVTKKMRGWFRYQFKITLKANVLKIPARHPLKKAMLRYLNQQKKVNKDIEKELVERWRKLKGK